MDASEALTEKEKEMTVDIPEKEFKDEAKLPEAESLSGEDVAKSVHDFRFGCGGFTPDCLQFLNKIEWLLFFMFIARFQQAMTSFGFVGVSISGIEKRFGLTSTQTGILVSTWEVVGTPFVLFVSYIGTVGHRMRLLAFGVFMGSLGCFVYATPHFLSGVYHMNQHSKGAKTELLCPNTLNSTDIEREFCESQKESPLSDYFYFFLVGQILLGIGASPLYTVGVTVIDDCCSKKKSSLYTGLYMSADILGPAVGFIGGALMLDFYTDFWHVDTDSLDVDSSHPQWVGAWWIAFMFSGSLGLAVMLPLFAFPRDLPGAAELRAQKISEVQKGAKDIHKEISLKHIPSIFKSLLTNWSFMMLMVFGIFIAFVKVGFSGFGAKYYESVYSLPPSTAGSVYGSVLTFGGAGGSIIGGYVAKRYDLSVTKLLKYGFAIMVGVVFLIPILYLHCSDRPLAGLNTPYTNASSVSLSSMCNAGCRCDDQQFEPVCADEGLMFYSPCHAGCTTIVNNGIKEYYNCSCIATEMHAAPMTTKKCHSFCKYLPVSAIGLLVMIFMALKAEMFVTISLLRVVPSSIRTLGLAVENIFSRIVGGFNGPLAFGMIFDNSCLKQRKGCGVESSCLYYSRQSLVLRVIMTTLGGFGGAAIFMFLAWRFYKPPTQENEEDTEKGVNGDCKKEPIKDKEMVVMNGKKSNKDLDPLYVNGDALSTKAHSPLLPNHHSNHRTNGNVPNGTTSNGVVLNGAVPNGTATNGTKTNMNGSTPKHIHRSFDANNEEDSKVKCRTPLLSRSGLAAKDSAMEAEC